MSFAKSPFYQLHQLADQCFGHLEADFHPRELWQIDEPERLADSIQTMRGVIEGLDSGLRRLAAEADERFRGVMELEEWGAIESEAPEWERTLGRLRPAADIDHVKRQILGIRVRVSELADSLAVRSAVRDPGNRADNSHEAVRSVARLQRERGLREVALSLLEGITWRETLEGSVTDWSTDFGPQHRIELHRLCDRLGQSLTGLESLPGTATRQLVQSTAETRDKIRSWNQRLSEVPVTRVDAGTASDFQYLAELAKKAVEAVQAQYRALLKEYEGREIPSEITELLSFLGLRIPKVRPKLAAHGGPQPTTREELERELGRRIVSTIKEDELS